MENLLKKEPKQISFRGIECLISKDRNYKNHLYPYKYKIRHADNNMKKPVTIEEHVAVNYYCTILSKEPLPLNDGTAIDRYCKLTDNEEKNIRLLMI